LHPTSTLYKFSLLILSPLALAYVIYRSFKDGGWQYFKQRLGFGYTKFTSKPIHFHCASVGEFITAKSLITAISSKYSNKQIIITTNTPTAANLVKNFSHTSTSHHYLPIDLAFSVNRFLRKVHPACSIILETEIWPTYYSCAAKNNIPLAIINARLSKKTFAANAFIKKEYSRALKNIDLLLARSKEDCEKYKILCPDIASTHIVGNLKYAATTFTDNGLACTTIKRPFFLAASTHESEELLLAEHVTLLRKSNYLLILAPRYPDRCKALAQQLKDMSLNVSIRSSHDEITENTDIYLIDTLGELNMFFNESALTFIGGSLIPRGGHNVLEPASFGKCILVGPHTDNFSLEVKELLQAHAIIQIDNNFELGQKLVALLKNDTQREKYGKNALLFMQKQSDVLPKYLDFLRTILE